LRCSPNRLDSTPKFCQEPVPGVFYDPAAVQRDRRFYGLRQEHGQARVRFRQTNLGIATRGFYLCTLLKP